MRYGLDHKYLPLNRVRDDPGLYFGELSGNLSGHDDGYVLELVCDADWALNLLLALLDRLVSRRAKDFRTGKRLIIPAVRVPSGLSTYPVGFEGPAVVF